MVAAEFGFKVVYTGSFPNDTTDFNPVVQKALEAKADVFSPIDGWPYHMGSIIKVARASGYKGPLFNVTPSAIGDVFDAAGGGKEVEGFFLASYYEGDPKLPPITAEAGKRLRPSSGSSLTSRPLDSTPSGRWSRPSSRPRVWTRLWWQNTGRPSDEDYSNRDGTGKNVWTEDLRDQQHCLPALVHHPDRQRQIREREVGRNGPYALGIYERAKRALRG